MRLALVLLLCGCMPTPQDFKRTDKNYPIWICTNDDDAGEPDCYFIEVIEV